MDKKKSSIILIIDISRKEIYFKTFNWFHNYFFKKLIYKNKKNHNTVLWWYRKNHVVLSKEFMWPSKMSSLY